MKTLYKNALILARQLDFDVFNALDILDNQEVFEVSLNFLNFYIFLKLLPFFDEFRIFSSSQVTDSYTTTSITGN